MTRVTVIGGGLCGLVSAWALAREGVEVTVHDAGLDGAASPVAAGMLAPGAELTDGESDLHRLGAECVRLWPALAARLAAESGLDVGLRTEGTLLLASDRDELAQLDHHRLRLEAHQVRHRSLDRSALRRCEPAVMRGVQGGVQLPDDLSVDTTAVLAALRAALARKGVRPSTRAAQPVRERGRVIGVDAGDGLERADAVVLAAGAHSGTLVVPLDREVPVRPVKGELMRVRTEPGVITHTLRARVAGVEVYLVPRVHGEIVVGATSADAGFDTRRTPRAALDLLGAAVRLVPELRDAELVSHDVGLRPATPDNGPLLGVVEPGLVLATGHYRHGYLLAPATTRAVVDGVMGHESLTAATKFSPERLVPRGEIVS